LASRNLFLISSISEGLMSEGLNFVHFSSLASKA